ncbi:MAG: cyclic nucleotide-binding domain-containing protein [Treponema sp.]|jgi:anti-sigma regulatory factor (Ser/Thr protein kinase)|nr:cyclic nucleotide-binding domain-containing protein [Treponema sp.]
MGSLGVINSDPAIRKSLEEAFEEDARRKDYNQQEYDLIFFSTEEEILGFLNYDLPEIIIVNFSDPSIPVDRILTRVRDDNWFSNFGIVGLYRNEEDTETRLLEKYKFINVLTMLDKHQIRSHICTTIQIIEKNLQIIFQQEFNQNLLSEMSGSFTIENDILAIPLYAGMGIMLLTQRGLIDPDRKMPLQLALSELIVNAVEHGNCGITYDEKTAGMDRGLSVVELVAEKCRDPVIRARKVEFIWNIGQETTSFIIRDEGQGFDVRAHLKKIADQDLMSLHGRGIKMATLYAVELKYNDTGNQVTMTIRHDSHVERDVPLGFAHERVQIVKKGDIILREDEPSDYLYYIVSGTYSVYHNLKKVGSLTPRDIFMGEMSFLLNRRRSASVRADGPGKLIFLTRKNFVGIIHSYPHYGIFLSKLLARRLVRSNDRNAELLEKIGNSR